MEKLRHREVKKLAPHPPAGKVVKSRVPEPVFLDMALFNRSPGRDTVLFEFERLFFIVIDNVAGKVFTHTSCEHLKMNSGSRGSGLSVPHVL